MCLLPLQADEERKDEPKITKWYMGDYAVNEGKNNCGYNDFVSTRVLS